MLEPPGGGSWSFKDAKISFRGVLETLGGSVPASGRQKSGTSEARTIKSESAAAQGGK